MVLGVGVFHGAKHSPLQKFSGHPKGQFPGVDRNLGLKVGFLNFQHIKRTVSFGTVKAFGTAAKLYWDTPVAWWALVGGTSSRSRLFPLYESTRR